MTGANQHALVYLVAALVLAAMSIGYTIAAAKPGNVNAVVALLLDAGTAFLLVCGLVAAS